VLGRHGNDHMVVGFIATYAISAYHHLTSKVVSLNPIHGMVYSNIMW